jgi:hypothetical protein
LGGYFTAKSCYWLTVHLSHEGTDERLLVGMSLGVNFFPAWQHGIPLVVCQQFDIGIFAFALDLVAIGRFCYP